MPDSWKVAVMGECMVELHRENAHLVQTYGGDTFNTATYLSRICGQDVYVDYMSAVGAGDSFSEGMLNFWHKNGVHSTLTQKISGKLPGLYAIEVDEHGERSFLYWRNEAAVRNCFETSEAADMLKKLEDYQLIYLSGISLAVLEPESREAFLKSLEKLAAQGVRIAFDFNLRPHLWGDDFANSQPHYKRVCAIADWVFLSPEELLAVGIKPTDPEDANFIEQIKSLGAREVIIKNGDKPCLVYNTADDKVTRVELDEKLDPVDTTAAGDSFTAAYLGAIRYNLPVRERVRRAQKLAGAVIMHPGAIIPEAATPKIFNDMAASGN